MATRTETNVVYAAGLVQGIVLVTFPAASTIFTDPDEYDLSSSQYGAMFLPQVITAIAGSLLGAGLARRHGSKRVYLAGLTASLVSMGLLVASTPFTDDHALAYGLLLVATALPRRRLRAHRADPQHVHRGVPSRGGRPVRPRAQRPPRARHRAGADLRGDLRRPRLLVGAAGAVGDPARRAHRRQPTPAACTPAAAARRPRRGRRSRAGSRCTPRSPCSTASARR